MSTLILVGVAVGWLVTQVLTWQAAKWVIQRARDESVQQKDEVVEHFNERLEGVEGHFNEQLEAFEGRFSEAYKTDMETISAEMNKIPERIKFTIMSKKGEESRALQSYLDKEGVDVDQAMELMEGQVMQDNPQMMLQMALKKAYEADVSDKYRKDNPVKAFIFDAGKAAVLPHLEQAFLGTSNLPGRKKGNATNPYGL